MRDKVVNIDDAVKSLRIVERREMLTVGTTEKEPEAKLTVQSGRITSLRRICMEQVLVARHLPGDLKDMFKERVESVLSYDRDAHTI
jgi:hypothetical protein